MVIGHRSGPVGFLYSGLTIFFLVVFGFALSNLGTENGVMMTVISLIFLLICFFIEVGYWKTPKRAIVLQDNNKILLPGKGVILTFGDIKDISYVRATARGIQYKWGKVILVTNAKKYKIGYLSNCEAVAKCLTELKFKYDQVNK